MENREPGIKIIARKNGTVLLCGGYQYYKHKTYKNESEIWKCSMKNKIKCKGSVTLQHNNIIKRSIHNENCKPDFAKNDVAEKIHEARTLATTSDSSINKIYNDIIVPLQDKGYDFVAKVPSLSSCKTAMYSERNKALCVSKTVFKNLEEVEVPKNYAPYLVGDYREGGSRILVFISEEAKDILAQLREFFIDGTFDSCPSPFVQLFTIHGNMGNSTSTTNVIPLVYALLSDKKESTYFALFDIITSQIPTWQPTVIHADFETASTNAIRMFFPDINIRRCYYHLCNSLWRRSKSLGIKQKLERRIVGLCTALPLLPRERITEGWEYIQSECPELPKLKKFLKYVQGYWMKSEDFINEWCVYAERHRTNNVVESWNSKINKLINKNNVTLIRLLNVLLNDAACAKFKNLKFQTNDCTTVRRALYKQKDEYVLATQMQLVTNEITVGQFLEKLR